MSLINCPECGKIFSDKAMACPNCGYPIKALKKELININKVRGDREDNYIESESNFQNIPSPLKRENDKVEFILNKERSLLGFRSDKTSHKVIACTYFTFVIVFFFTSIMPDTDKYQYIDSDIFKRTIQIIISTLMLISPIMILSENGIRDKSPIFKHRKRPLTIMGFVLIFFLTMFLSRTIGSSMSDKHHASVVAYKNTIKTVNNNQEANIKPTIVPTSVPEKTPMALTTDDLFNELTENALKASKTYKGQCVEVTGKMSIIDSSGNYFLLSSLSDGFLFRTILCNISKEHLNTVINFKNEQEVTVIGTITDVGEIMGYVIEVDSIK